MNESEPQKTMPDLIDKPALAAPAAKPTAEEIVKACISRADADFDALAERTGTPERFRESYTVGALKAALEQVLRGCPAMAAVLAEHYQVKGGGQ